MAAPEDNQQSAAQTAAVISYGNQLDEPTYRRTGYGSGVYDLILVGDPGVGKTSLLSRAACRKFNEDYIETTAVDSVSTGVIE